MEAMAGMKDKAYDLAIVDPPYGIGEDASRGGHQYGKAATMSKKYTVKSWDDKPMGEIFFKELIRVSKNQIIFGANHFISKIPFDSSCWIVWDKVNNGNNYADCELAWTSFKTATRKIKLMWNGMLQHDMKNKEVRIHPTQKPVRLYQWLLKNYAKTGDRILDTHGGSCSLAIACDIMGFDCDIWEIDEDYHKAAVERFRKHRMQEVLDL